jgi:hypothetical protein
MRLAKVPSAFDYRLKSHFELVRQRLLQDKFAPRLEKPLAFWALPKDRRLPLAFLGRTVGDLLQTPFDELVATPGVGQKKIQAMLELLRRATDEQTSIPAGNPVGGPTGFADFDRGRGPLQSPTRHEPVMPRPNGTFDPTLVSELVWDEWRETVRRHGLEHEKLGRLAPSLQPLPTVIWHAPLGTYLPKTISQIRCLKTYGEKRVRVVLEVFHALHTMLSSVRSHGSLAVNVMPAFVPPIRQWIGQQLERDDPASAAEIQLALTQPMLEQIRVDTGDTVCQLAAARLGLDGVPHNVRTLARRLSVTRARVYQLLDESHKVIEVRWPEGRGWLDLFADHLAEHDADKSARELLDATRELFWPRRN